MSAIERIFVMLWEGGFCGCCLSIFPSAWLLYLIGGKALLAVRTRSEVACVRSRRRYHRTGDGGVNLVFEK